MTVMCEHRADICARCGIWLKQSRRDYSIGTACRLSQRRPNAGEAAGDLRRDRGGRACRRHANPGSRPEAGRRHVERRGSAPKTMNGARNAGASGIVRGLEDGRGITDFAKRRSRSPARRLTYCGNELVPATSPAKARPIEMSIRTRQHAHQDEVADRRRQDAFAADGTDFKMFAAHGYRGYMGPRRSRRRFGAAVLPLRGEGHGAEIFGVSGSVFIAAPFSGSLASRACAEAGLRPSGPLHTSAAGQHRATAKHAEVRRPAGGCQQKLSYSLARSRGEPVGSRGSDSRAQEPGQGR